MTRIVRPVFLLALLLSVAAQAQAQIAWETSYETATARAREEGRVLFIAVNMDGERANDELAEQVYRDKRVVELTSATVNLVASRFSHSPGSSCKRFAGITCDDHKKVEVAIRGALIKEDESGFVIAPQHLLLAPDGSVILSVPYGVSTEELIWCLVSARRTLAAEAALVLPEDATPPRRLIMQGVHDPTRRVVFVRPLSEDELEASIKSMRKGWGAIEDMQRFNQILATDHPLAIKYATTEIGSGITSSSSQFTCSLVREIARYSPPSFWQALESSLSQGDERLRCEVAAALEQLADKKSLPAIRRAWSKERSSEVKGDLLRAMGAAGAGNAGIARTLVSTGKSDSDMNLRLNATLALAFHAERKEVREFLIAALADGDPRVRQAAALAMAFSRRAEFLSVLEAATQSEQDKLLVALDQRALEVLAGGNLRQLAPDYQRIGGDSVRRVRFFGDE